MLSIAEYAKTRHISQTAIRRQLKTYAEELEGHIVETNRRKMLDDDAIAFLDAHRMPREIIIEQASSEAKKEVEDLKAKLDLMKDRVQELHQHALRLQDEIISLQKEKIEMIEDQTRNQLLLEAKDKESTDLQDKLESMEQDNRDLQTRLTEAEKEANSYVKSWFGLYRRKDD